MGGGSRRLWPKRPPAGRRTKNRRCAKISNDDRILFGLGLVDFYAARHEELTSHFVLLSDDPAMVHARGNRSQNATRRSQQLLDWAGDSQERNAALKKYCKAVLAGDFTLDQYSLAALQKLAGE